MGLSVRWRRQVVEGVLLEGIWPREIYEACLIRPDTGEFGGARRISLGGVDSLAGEMIRGGRDTSEGSEGTACPLLGIAFSRALSSMVPTAKLLACIIIHVIANPGRNLTMGVNNSYGCVFAGRGQN